MQEKLLVSAAGLMAESRFALIVVDSATVSVLRLYDSLTPCPSANLLSPPQALFRNEFVGRGQLAERQVSVLLPSSIADRSL